MLEPGRYWTTLLALVLCALPACSETQDSFREGVEDGYEQTAPGDSVIDAVPVFPADSGLLDNSGNAGAPGPGGGAIAPGATPEGGAGATQGGTTSPTTPPPSGSGSSQTAPADAILARAAQAYAGVRTLRADFEQETENPVLRRTTTSRGTIFQSRPDRFLMRFSEPAGDRIVADGEYIWVYYPSVDAQQVIRMRAGAGGAGAVDLQAQFLGDPTQRFDASVVGEESVGGRAADVLVLTPRGNASFRSLKVWVDRRDSLVRRFEITEHNGVIRRFLLNGLTPGANVDADLFRFTPPEGAHVVARG